MPPRLQPRPPLLAPPPLHLLPPPPGLLPRRLLRLPPLPLDRDRPTSRAPPFLLPLNVVAWPAIVRLRRSPLQHWRAPTFAPHGSAWARHGTILAGPGDVLLVLTELAALSYSPSERSGKWMKHPLSLPSKPRSPSWPPAPAPSSRSAMSAPPSAANEALLLPARQAHRRLGARQKGAVTLVKNQGKCVLKLCCKKLLGLLDDGGGGRDKPDRDGWSHCRASDGSRQSFDHGRGGGLMDFAYAYIVGNQGIHTDGDYPYLMERATARRSRLPHSKVVTISGYEDVSENSELSLLKALAHQPISVGIAAGSRDFQFYKGGVFEGTCGAQLDHTLTAVGYGSSDGEDYIIMKNSWGGGCGEQGYCRIKRGTRRPEGVCDIYRIASYPTKNNSTGWGGGLILSAPYINVFETRSFMVRSKC
ncbi:hypothetical protein ZWY2020_025066 [Hordeum vulgare]|nr:hypothetical protein ZWY2020_025066 [Hordeum vulgare]